MSDKVVTRFAPSPTGYLHVGALRTALFAYAYAKNQGGKFLLRIEDTDKSREVEGAIDHIKESLAWLNIEPADEPLLQSERLDIYKEWAQKLIDDGKAYVDPYSAEDVQNFRDDASKAKKPFLFRNHRPKEEEAGDWYGSKPLRFKTEVKSTSWHDEVWGNLSAGEEAVDDFILIKSDGYPTYNFAHIIDDQLSGVTHIMRGEEFLASVPKYLMLYEALGIDVPKFASMPAILAPGGGKKLSKRDGAKDVLEYRNEGYLADSVFNYIASLGWNDGSEQEVFSPEEIIEKFSLDRIQKSGAQFDEKKLDWMNWEHTKLLVENDPAKLVNTIKDQGLSEVDETAIGLALTKATDLETLVDQLKIYPEAPGWKVTEATLSEVDKSLTTSRAEELINAAQSAINELSEFNADSIEKSLRDTMTKNDAQPREFLNLVRWAISGRKVSPNLFEMMEKVGQEESVKRLQEAL